MDDWSAYVILSDVLLWNLTDVAATEALQQDMFGKYHWLFSHQKNTRVYGG